jgi:hypothetical protein
MSHWPTQFVGVPLLLLLVSSLQAAELPWIAVSPDGKGFIQTPGQKPFKVRGFNYDHDDQGRLLEDYWEEEWDAVVEDFGEMKALGANVVRIHLQFGRFMETADRPNARSLSMLERLVQLAEKTGLYLDLTGLGCYHKQDVPAWYDALSEADRWEAQARFWEAIAARCCKSPAVFCYDLMNEPVVPGGKRQDGAWLGPAFAGKHFVQFVTLDQAGRPRPAIAREWIRRLVQAIRKHDQRHLVTVGLVDWSLDRPGLTSGVVPKEIAGDLDFLCVHIYPQGGKVAEALATLEGFDVGKPVLIEETFPLKCTLQEFEQFLDGAEPRSAGFVGFYWGKPVAELKKSREFKDALLLAWLECFQKRAASLTP